MGWDFFVEILLKFRYPWGILVSQIFWQIFLTNFLTNLFDEFFDKSFWRFFFTVNVSLSAGLTKTFVENKICQATRWCHLTIFQRDIRMSHGVRMALFENFLVKSKCTILWSFHLTSFLCWHGIFFLLPLQILFRH